ncbi:MAG TPA: NAD(P)-binding domain-containing protein [Terriglobales bacterium]
MENAIAFLIALVLVAIFSRNYMKKLKTTEARVREALAKAPASASQPRAQHPRIDALRCIGCATCNAACPEGDVLGMLDGRAVIINAQRCIGHAMCAEACPVGAIEMVMAAPGVGADLPQLTPEFETSVPNLFIIGELGGLALIKNAVSQGSNCIDVISQRLSSCNRSTDESIHDVIIVGAGPAGISASLRAIENGLRYLTIEREEIGGTVAKYPRQKLVMTSPVEFPIYGKFRKTELSKEELIAFWHKVLKRTDFKARTGENVEQVQRDENGIFRVKTDRTQYSAKAVVLAMGRAGTPKRLGVPGEELPKVMYRLIEADQYTDKNVLVVGGGDSAVEAALGLAHQSGNRVTLSYRKDAFSRIKQRNAQHLEQAVGTGKLEVIFNSIPIEFTPQTTLLDVAGQPREIPNDFVWIFAGGTAPNEFLRKVGVQFLSDVQHNNRQEPCLPLSR